MRTGFRVIALCVVLLSLALWLGTGAHVGWTKTTVTEMKVDPVTELEYPETRAAFVAGVEVLGAGLVLALVLVGGSFGFPSKPKIN